MSLQSISRILFFFFFFGFLAFTSQAQDASKDANSLLPDIDPQDIEIRGDYRATFPGLRRQPILGFNPRPRVFRIDPDRMPFLETRDDIIANIPISELQKPVAPTWSPFTSPEASRFVSEGGYGMYENGYGSVYSSFSLSEKWQLLADLSFDSNGLYADTIANSRRNGAGELTFLHRPDAAKKRAYVLGMRNAFQTTFERTAPAVTYDALRTDINQFWGGFVFESQQTAYDHSRLNAKVNYSEFHTSTDLSMLEIYGQYHLRRSGARPMTAWDVELAGHYQTQQFESYVVQTGLHYLIRSNFNSRLTLGGKAFVSRDALRAKTILNAYPTLNYEFWVYNPFTIRVYMEGEVHQQGSSTFLTHPRLNPTFANGLPVERNFTVGTHARYRFGSGSEFYTGFFFRFHQNLNLLDGNFGFLTNAVTPAGVNALTLIQENGAQVFRYTAGFKRDILAEKMRLNVSGWIVNAKLADGNDIPFMERFGASADLTGSPSTRFSYYLSGRALWQRNGDFVSTNIYLVDARVDYHFSKRFGVFAAGYNLLQQEYSFWSIFQEQPFRVLGGLKLNM